MVTHESWTGKKCPVLLLAPSKWAAFQKLVKGYLDSIQTVKNTRLRERANAANFEFKGCQCSKKSDHEVT
jgi:N-acetylmuramoyl-L-alanine amidase CwlA